MKARASMKLIGSAAAALLLLFTAPSVLAGSVTQPGDTMGTPSGAQTPPGFIFTNQANAGCRDTNPRTCFWTEVPLIAWSTPWRVLGGNLLFAAGPTTWVNVDIHDTYQASGWFNPFVGAKLAWDLGDGWGFGYLLGGYFNVDSDVAYSSSSLNQRFGLSYTGNGWDLTANVIWGINFDQVTNDPQGISLPDRTRTWMQPELHQRRLHGDKAFRQVGVGSDWLLCHRHQHAGF